MTLDRCEAETRSGRSCRNRPKPGHAQCWVHRRAAADPDPLALVIDPVTWSPTPDDVPPADLESRVSGARSAAETILLGRLRLEYAWLDWLEEHAPDGQTRDGQVLQACDRITAVTAKVIELEAGRAAGSIATVADPDAVAEAAARVRAARIDTMNKGDTPTTEEVDADVPHRRTFPA